MIKTIRYSPAALTPAAAFAVSLTSLILYLLDLNYSDKVLFILLNALKFSSLFLCVCSFYSLVLSIFGIFKKPSAHAYLRMFVYIILIVYSLTIFFLEAFIKVIAGGNE